MTLFRTHARTQSGAGGVRGGDGGAGPEATGADRSEPAPGTQPAARLLRGRSDDDVPADEPVPSVPTAGPRARARPPQGQRRADHPAPGRRRRRARRPEADRRRVGARGACPWLVRRQRRRRRSGACTCTCTCTCRADRQRGPSSVQCRSSCEL